MAATVNIYSYHGNAANTGNGAVSNGSIGGTNINGLPFRFKRADNDTVDLNNEVQLPPDLATHYSWRKHTKLALTTLPTSQCSNLRWFLDPLPDATVPARAWDGISFYAGICHTYVQASANDEAGLLSGVSRGDGQPVGFAADADLQPFNAQNPLVVYAGVFLGRELGVGLTQPFVVAQMSVNARALSGEKDPRGYRYRYTEV